MFLGIYKSANSTYNIVNKQLNKKTILFVIFFMYNIHFITILVIYEYLKIVFCLKFMLINI